MIANQPALNAFEQFSLPSALELDEPSLRARYDLLRIEFHPDRFASASPLERRLAVQRAADINAAFNVLHDPLSRAQHFFALRGIALDEAQTLQDGEFLMQQMELREALEHAHNMEAIKRLEQQVDALWQRNWHSLLDAAQSVESAHIRALLQRLQFVQRFKQQLQQKLSQNGTLVEN